MRVSPSETLLTIPRAPPARIQHWAVGQTITATVIGRDSANSIRIEVEGKVLSATTQLPLRVGAEVRLEVVTTGATPTLKALAFAPAGQASILRESLKEVLPRQQPLKPAFDSMSNALKTSATGDAAPPVVVTRAIRGAIETLATAADATDPRRLMGKLRESGLALEAELRQRVLTGSDEPPDGDLKWQLLKVRHAIDSAAMPAADGKATSAALRPPAADGTTPPRRDSASAGSVEVDARSGGTAAQSIQGGRTDVTGATPADPAATADGDPVYARQSSVGVPEEPPNDQPAFRHRADAGPGTRAAAGESEAPSGREPRAAREEILVDLRRQVDNAIARIQTHQLQTLSADAGQALHLVFELPIRWAQHFDALRIEVDREAAQHDEDHARPVVITVHIAMHDTGALTARIVLRDETMAVSLWADDPALRLRVTEHLGLLAERFRASGLDAQSIVMAPVRIGDEPRSPANGLIDTAI